MVVMPNDLPWHPSSSKVVGWTNDGKNVVFASSRNTAPTGFDCSMDCSAKWWAGKFTDIAMGNKWFLLSRWQKNGHRQGRQWDVEWRAYRGGQNTPLIIIDLDDLSETLLPNNSTTDIHPVWMGDIIYFLSDRDWTSNIWSYSPDAGDLKQITNFSGSDVKWLACNNKMLTFERDGSLHSLNPETGQVNKLEIIVKGDFPWAETGWENVNNSIRSVSISPTGKRVIMEARGEIFTTPAKYGDSRNLTKALTLLIMHPSGRLWADRIAWFSDKGGSEYKANDCFTGWIIRSQDHSYW